MLHIINIRNKEKHFDVGGGPTFLSLVELVEHYQKNTIITMSGGAIQLKVPVHATSFLPANVAVRVFELQKQCHDVYGTDGFWEEFQVSLLRECMKRN